MNKQELIEKYEKLEGVCKDPGAEIARLIFLEDLKELDKPQNPVVPQIVADYIKYTKETEWDLLEAMDDVAYEDNKDLRKWFNDNIETFARAWLDGYEVDKEKRYLVKMKGISENSNCLNYDSIDDKWYFTDDENGPAVGTHHTRKQLEEAGFWEVFNSPLFEVEEVD